MADSLLTDKMLEAFRGRAATYDRENTFFHEDFEELRDAGYLKIAVPQELGGDGLDLGEVSREQRRLAAYAPSDAVAVNMHIYWTGLAADMFHVGDTSMQWLLEDATNGGVYAAGHSERGNDIPLLLSTTSAERVDDGWKFTGHKNFGTMTPVWTKLGFHGMDTSNPEAPQIVHAFLDRESPDIEIVETWDSLGMRATRSDDTVLRGAYVPDSQVVRVIPAGAAGMDLFVLGVFGWALVGFANVYYSIARRMLDLTVAYVGDKTSLGLGGGPYSSHPEVVMRCDAMLPHLEAVATGYATSVRDAGNWTEMTAPGWVREFVGLKHMVTKASLEVANLAIEAVGGLGVARHGEFERLYRDARMGPIHPANPQLTHELLAKITLGIDLDGQPRWGG
jgi:alkylation response protein AidB-like acyl-CoA dehydrogenase